MTDTDTDTETASALTRVVEGREVPPVGTYVLDVAHSLVGFVVRHVMVSKVRGQFNEFEGLINVGEDFSSSTVEVTIQVASVDTREPKRDEHLRTSDFFEAETYPTISFHSTKLEPSGSDWTLDGELTIKGVTRPVKLNLEYNGASTDPWGGVRIGFSAWLEIDREDYGMTYNAALEAGGVMVGKAVRIELEVEAIQQPAS